MADIVIRGMKMPEYCHECPLQNMESGYCQYHKDSYRYSAERPASCPLILLLPHGRLVDGDALLAAFEEYISEQTKHMELLRSVGDMKSYFDISNVQIGMGLCRRALGNTPTIIEANQAEKQEGEG